MRVRLSIFLPLVLFTLLFVAYVQTTWLPQIAQSFIKLHDDALKAHIKSIADSLVPLLLENQLAAVYENLDTLKEQNPTWLSIQVINDKETQIYPLSKIKIKEIKNPDHKMVKQTIGYLNPYLGELVILIDTSNVTAQLTRLENGLQYAMYFLMMIFVITIGGLLEFMVGRRLQSLNNALLGSEVIKTSILDTAGESIISINEKGIIGQFNKAAERLTGYRFDEIIGKNITMIMPEAFSNQHNEYLKHYLQTGVPKVIGQYLEVMIIHKDGREIPATLSIADTGIEGKYRFTGILHDQTQTIKAQKELQASEKKLQDYTNALATFTSMLTPDGKIELVNSSAIAVTGLTIDDFVGQYLWDSYWCNYDSDNQKMIKQDVLRCASGKTVDREMFVQIKKGRFLTIHFIMTPILNDEGTVIYLVAEGQDITERKNTELLLQEKTKELEFERTRYKHLSESDPLTKIPNRRVYEQLLTKEVQAAFRSNQPLALIMIDIDYFKQYNDLYGHDAGDVTLRRIAEVITEGLPRSTDLAARFGGEEFVIIMPSTDVDGAYLVAERIRLQIKSLKISHKGSEFNVVTVSIGVASLKGKQLTEGDLLRKADKALYVAKGEGRDHCSIFLDEK